MNLTIHILRLTFHRLKCPHARPSNSHTADLRANYVLAGLAFDYGAGRRCAKQSCDLIRNKVITHDAQSYN